MTEISVIIACAKRPADWRSSLLSSTCFKKLAVGSFHARPGICCMACVEDVSAPRKTGTPTKPSLPHVAVSTAVRSVRTLRMEETPSSTKYTLSMGLLTS